MPSDTVTIWAHHDADGITSAHFTSFGVPNSVIKIVDKFGDTEHWKAGDYMVDMRPDNPNIEGNVIDHHLPHPEKHSYKLIEGDVPASLLCWQEFKDKIPKTEWWKLAIGLMGDGQPELMPTEVWDSCPALLKDVKSSIYQSYGKWNVSTVPLYKLMSSSLNAFLRKGEYESAINLIKYAESPLDIYTSEDVAIAKMQVRNEFSTAVKDCEVYLFDNLAVVMFYSKYRMSGYVSSSLQNTAFSGKTTMAINKRDGSLSLRGDLATYIRDKIKGLDYIDVDGHAGFMGGKLLKNYHNLIKDLNQIL